MPNVCITDSDLFSQLNVLNRCFDEDVHYYILFDEGYFCLYLNSELIFKSSNIVDFYGKLCSEINNLCYPNVPKML